MTKHRTPEENVLYNAKILYECLEKAMHVDELFMEYYKRQSKELNNNMEYLLFLSLTLLYSMGKVTVTNSVIKRVHV
ncbi:ABC-three component system middle component 6 [Bacillus cereus]|nr:ABC-three component system middle component 6 [Bacillus cereus]